MIKKVPLNLTFDSEEQEKGRCRSGSSLYLHSISAKILHGEVPVSCLQAWVFLQFIFFINNARKMEISKVYIQISTFNI